MSATSSKLIKGATGDWEMVIGLEVHAQVTSNSKLFSGASTEFGGAPNSHVSLVDAAMPGMLPVINEYCVAQAVRTGFQAGLVSIVFGPAAEDASALAAGIPADQVVTLDAAQFEDEAALLQAIVSTLASGSPGNARLTDGAGI